MPTGGEPSPNEIVDMFLGRPGWRLEPRSTPGSTPLWCFVSGGKIEFSVSVDSDAALVRLYVMETDQEITFGDAEGLMAWLRANRPEATLDPEQSAPTRRSRFRRLTEWE
jgi:hypothetical protein